MSLKNKLSYSIICASKNEEKDIIYLLKSFKKIKSDSSELIIIDDSTDNTKQIVSFFAKKDPRIKLINGKNRGCCEARNFGIKKSKGDIIIFMTADSFFSYDLVKKIHPFYLKGYDAVLLNSRVYNVKNVYANFIYCNHLRKLEKKTNFKPLTTQGYSVRKTAAIKAGLIEKGNFKPNICRDWTLVKKMDKKNYKKVFLKNLSCNHIAPDNFKNFFMTHFTRGQISSGYQFFFLKKNKIKILLRSFAKLVIFCFYIGSLLKWLENNINFLKHNKNKNSNLFKFLFLDFLKRTAFLFGEIISTVKFKKQSHI